MSTELIAFKSYKNNPIEHALNLNEYLIQHPASTFMFRVKGDAMINAGIHNNSILIVDRSLKPSDGNIIVGIVNGDLVVRRIRFFKSSTWLLTENAKYKAFKITLDTEFEVWGVAIHVINSFKNKL